MIKALGIRIGVLLVLLTLTFSTVAKADGGTTFRLLLEDTTTGKQRVITDNAIWGTILQRAGNVDVNANSGVIGGSSGAWSGAVGQNIFVTIEATSAKASDGGGILTMMANVQYTNVVGGGNDNFAIVLEDVYGADTDGANAALQNTIQGYNYVTNAVTPMAVLSSGGSLSVQSWLNPMGVEPNNLGANSGAVTATTNLANIPNATDYTASGASQTPVTTLGTSTAIYSEALVSFANATSGGSASFTFTAAEVPLATPEPTSLVLLGSGLLGLGVLQSRKKILNIHRSKAVD